MNLLDLLVLMMAVSAALGGYRLGLIARVTSWVGMGAGLVISAALLPTIIENLQGPDATGRLLVAAALLIGGAFVGQAIGLLVGARLHLAIPEGPGRLADRGAGSVAGIVGVIVAVWVLLPTMADVPGWPSEQARHSRLARWVDELMPAPPDTLRALRQLVGETPFPRVFDALRPTPDVGPPPADSGLSEAVTRRVVQSTVRVEGIACNRVQEGSGFTVAPGVVVTNAHVVAGEDETDLIRPDGTRVSATVTVFDPDRDLAILHASGLGEPALPIGDGGVGTQGAVFGYPGGGPLRISPFKVSQQVEAVGRDLYDRHETRRNVYILASDLHPGDSGAALVNRRGVVVGVAFAIAPDRPKTAYALTSAELRAALREDVGQAVDTGPCLR